MQLDFFFRRLTGNERADGPISGRAPIKPSIPRTRLTMATHGWFGRLVMCFVSSYPLSDRYGHVVWLVYPEVKDVKDGTRVPRKNRLDHLPGETGDQFLKMPVVILAHALAATAQAVHREGNQHMLSLDAVQKPPADGFVHLFQHGMCLEQQRHLHRVVGWHESVAGEGAAVMPV